MFRRILLPAAAVAVLLSTPAFAQIAPGYTDGYQQPSRAGSGQGASTQHRLQEFHAKLGITPAQEPQWDAMVAVLRDNARAMRASPAAQAVRSNQLTAIQALHAAADVANERAQSLQRMIPPVEALYAALSPEQRQTFDQSVDRLIHRPGGSRRS